MDGLSYTSTSALTPRQQRFVDEYLLDLNATQAATRAGYSARTANEQGARLLAKASVAQAVEAAQRSRGERLQVTQDDVLEGLLLEARRTGPGSSHSARVAALGLLGKHLGMFTERTQQADRDREPTDQQQTFVLVVER
jgi:phage terminase small subunit